MNLLDKDISPAPWPLGDTVHGSAVPGLGNPLNQ